MSQNERKSPEILQFQDFLWQRALIMIPLILDAPHFAGGVHFQFVGCILSVSDAPQGVDAAPRQSLQLFLLRQHRIMGQGDSARDFDPSERMENAGILCVFPIFHTARLGQKIRRSPQRPLCGVALKL